MNNEQESTVNRKKIGIRFLYTVLFVVVLEILKIIIQVTVLFQFIYLFISKKHSEPVRRFSNKVTIYCYRVLRYVCLNENPRPYPFANFPTEIEQPADTVVFG